MAVDWQDLLTGKKRDITVAWMLPDTSSAPAQVSASGRQLALNWWRVVAMIWSGQAFSIVTSGASGWAIIWHVTTTEGSALKLALVMALSQLPLGLLAPLGGLAADRYNRRTVMIVSDLGAGVMSLALGALAWFGHGTFALICLFAALRSCFQAFHFPAMSAAMPMLVPEKHLMRVNALDQAIGSIANIGSPAIGIALYTTFGLPYTLGLEFAGALLAVAGLALARIPSVEAEMPPTIMGQIRQGWRALNVHSGLVILIVVLTAGMMVFAAIQAVYPLMAQQHFGADGGMVSIAEAITGTCMLVGVVIMMAWGGGQRLALLMSCTIVIVGFPIAATGLLPRSGFWAFVALMGFACVFLAWFHPPLMTLIQRHVGEDKVGRAVGFFQLMLGLAMPLGVALGGAIAEWTGLPALFTAAGLFFCILGAAMYAVPSIRDLDAPTPAASPVDGEG